MTQERKKLVELKNVSLTFNKGKSNEVEAIDDVSFEVCIDLKMPRIVNSTNELLHGNISKVLVLITAASLTVVEIILVGGNWVPIPLLPFACLAGAGVAAGEYGYWKFCKGDFYDTDS